MNESPKTTITNNQQQRKRVKTGVDENEKGKCIIESRKRQQLQQLQSYTETDSRIINKYNQTAEQVKLFEALISAFNENELKRLVQYNFSVSLDEISLADDLQTKVFDLLNWAKNKNLLDDLLLAAIKENPTNELLSQLLREKVKQSNKSPQIMPPPQYTQSPSKRSISDDDLLKALSFSNNEQVELVIINFQLAQLIERVDKLSEITIGEDGGNGLRGSITALANRQQKLTDDFENFRTLYELNSAQISTSKNDSPSWPFLFFALLFLMNLLAIIGNSLGGILDKWMT